MARIPQRGRLVITQTNSIKGWEVGDPINNLTKFGKKPRWNAVRQRYWKNRSSLEHDKYPASQIPRMKKGLAPQKFNYKTGKLESMELHHTPPQREGGLFDIIEVWPEEHAEIDEFRHIRK